MSLLRDKIDRNLFEIDMQIEVHQRMIDLYQRMIEKHGEWEYFDERLHELYKVQAEYLIAREETLEGKHNVHKS